MRFAKVSTKTASRQAGNHSRHNHRRHHDESVSSHPNPLQLHSLCCAKCQIRLITATPRVLQISQIHKIRYKNDRHSAASERQREANEVVQWDRVGLRCGRSARPFCFPCTSAVAHVLFFARFSAREEVTNKSERIRVSTTPSEERAYSRHD